MSNQDKAYDPNALLTMWREYYEGSIKGQQSLYPEYEAMATSAMKQTMDAARESWSAWEKQAADWLKAADNWFPTDMRGDPHNTLVAESLKRLLDPRYFSMAALDEVSGSVQRMAEGPEFADIGMFEKHMLQSTAEWLAMREAEAQYRQITGSAWSRAFQKYNSEMSVDWSRLATDPRKALDRWLEIANDELVRTQRQEDFLDASRKLFRATIEYRLKQREAVEIWCESQSIPTRTEVDDLHRTVTELRRELRQIKRQLAQTRVATSQNAGVEDPAPKEKALKEKALKEKTPQAKTTMANAPVEKVPEAKVPEEKTAVNKAVEKKVAEEKATIKPVASKKRSARKVAKKKVTRKAAAKDVNVEKVVKKKSTRVAATTTAVKTGAKNTDSPSANSSTAIDLDGGPAETSENSVNNAAARTTPQD